MQKTIKRRVFGLLAIAGRDDAASRLVDIMLGGLIVVNVLAVVVATLETQDPRLLQNLKIIEQVSIVIFTVEYLLRLWSSTEDESARYHSSLRGRIRYLFTPLMIFDLLAIVPYYFGISSKFDLRYLRLFRLVHTLKIVQYSPALSIMATVLKREAKTLVAAFFLLLVLLFIASAFIYYLEHDTQPQAFSSILHAMWWGTATLTTVGYGDIVPQTVAGKLFGILVMFVGIGMFAIPTGVLVSAFFQEIKRKDFQATWKMVARVPSFRRLDVIEVSNIAELLHLRIAMPGETLFKKGDPADCMYFIVTGEAEVDLGTHTIRLGSGEFFGEVSLIYKTTRMASVTAKTFAELLQLDRRDLDSLLETNEELRLRIMEEASKRRTQSHIE